MKDLIWLVFGLSGAGKSSFGDWLAAERNWLHLEIDVFSVDPDADGIDSHDLRSEWDEFYLRREARPLQESLQERIRAKSRSGAVLTFPSTWVPSREHIDNAMQEGIRTIFLYGPEANCRKAFLLREEKRGNKRDSQFWNDNNSRQHALIGQSRYDGERLQVFTPAGVRTTHDEVFAELLKRR